MSATQTVSVTNKDFTYAVKFLKKHGYMFDPCTKTWSGSKLIDMLIDDGYVRAAGEAVAACVSDDAMIQRIER